MDLGGHGHSPASRRVQSLAGFGLGRWLLRTRRAAALASDDVGLPLVALAGFLLRGGMLVVALPSVIVPSLLGLASVFGVNALGIDGRPTPWLIAAIAAACVAAVIWLAVALLVGSIVDVWLIRSARATDPLLVEEPQPLPGVWLVLGMAATRLACMVPLGVAVGLAARGLYDAGYGELTLPSNLGEPLLLRVAARASTQLALIAVAWLVTETIAAIAVRRLVLGDGFWGSLAGAVVQIVRRPVSSLLTLVVGAGDSGSVRAVPRCGAPAQQSIGAPRRCLDRPHPGDRPGRIPWYGLDSRDGVVRVAGRCGRHIGLAKCRVDRGDGGRVGTVAGRRAGGTTGRTACVTDRSIVSSERGRPNVHW